MGFRPCLYLAMLSRIPASLHYPPPHTHTHTHTHTHYHRLPPHLTLSIPLCVSCPFYLSSLSVLILPANFHLLFKMQHRHPLLSEAFLSSILPQAERGSLCPCAQPNHTALWVECDLMIFASLDLCEVSFWPLRQRGLPPNPQADAPGKDIWDLPWVSLRGRVWACRLG